MFKWIKVVSRLSKQDDIMGVLESRVSRISAQVESFVEESAKILEHLQTVKAETNSEIDRARTIVAEVKEEVEDIERKIAVEKLDMAKISGEMKSYEEAIVQKVEELRTGTQEHLNLVNEKIEAYNSNMSKLGEEIVRLGDSIAEFERR